MSVFGGCFSSPEAIRTFAASFSFAFLASQLESVPKQTPGLCLLPVTPPTHEAWKFTCYKSYKNINPNRVKWNADLLDVALSSRICHLYINRASDTIIHILGLQRACLFGPMAPLEPKNPNYRSLSSALCSDFFWMCLPIPVGGSENLLDQLK